MAIQPEPASKSETTDSAKKAGPKAPRKSFISWLALLALVLALFSLLLQVWQRAGDETAGLTAAVNKMQADRQAQQHGEQALQTELEGLAARLGQLENRQTPAAPPDFSAEISALQAETSRLARQSGAMQSRLVNQSAVTQTNDRHLARAEIEYLLKLGNERLQLFGDRQAALATLDLAERQLAAMDDPLMLPVRRQLQQDIRAVAGIELADPLIILSDIQSLESSLPEWPMKQMDFKPDTPADEAETGLWGRFKQSMSSLVTIRKQAEPMLTLEEIDWLQERIRTQFQVARIASLNGNQELFHTALQTVLQWHAEHYQPDNNLNTEVRRSLQKLMSAVLKPELPDITRALREMHYLGSPLTPAEEQQPAENVDEVPSGPAVMENSG